MTHPMPDPTDQPQQRMTTAQAAKLAQDAMALAADNGDQLANLSEKFTELDQRVRDITGTTVDPADVIDAEGKPVVTRDQVDSRIHEALQPLHDEVHELRQKGTLTPESKSSLAGVLARLEDAERKVAAATDGGIVTRVVQEVHPLLSDLRNRLATVEQELQGQGDPVSATLAEDHQSDQIEHMVDRKLAAMFEVAGLTPARLATLTREFDDLRQHVETHGTSVTQAIVNQVADELERRRPRLGSDATTAPSGTGAARKVLELMRMVTHIGKERQADMGTGGKFKFRGIDEAMDAVGHAMREVGLILSPEVLNEESSTTPVTKKGDGRNGPFESTVLWTTTKLTMRYTFVDPDDGSSHRIEMVGEGRDASDKSTSKAGSMAFKYGLLQGLCIPVTGLDDSDASPPQIMENERARPAQQQDERPAQQPTPDRTEQQTAQRAGEALQAIRNIYRVEGGPQAQYNRLVQIMNRVKAENLLGHSVDGSTLDQHGQAAMRTLQAPPPGNDMPPPDEPPADQGGY